MTIINTTTPSFPVNGSTKSDSVEKTSSSTTTIAAGLSSGDNLTLSGKALLLSRLFKMNDINADPKIEYVSTANNASGLSYSFLNAGDREMLAKIYEYASANNMDLNQVDALAFDMAVYRVANASGGNNDTTGIYSNGYIPHFSDSDTSSAKRMLSSDAINHTEINRDFLMTILHPGKKPVHAVDFNFLETVVNAFSTGDNSSEKSTTQKSVLRGDIRQLLERLDLHSDKVAIQQQTNETGKTNQSYESLARSAQDELKAMYQDLLLNQLGLNSMEKQAYAQGGFSLIQSRDTSSMKLDVISKLLNNINTPL